MTVVMLFSQIYSFQTFYVLLSYSFSC